MTIILVFHISHQNAKVELHKKHAHARTFARTLHPFIEVLNGLEGILGHWGLLGSQDIFGPCGLLGPPGLLGSFGSSGPSWSYGSIGSLGT